MKLKIELNYYLQLLASGITRHNIQPDLGGGMVNSESAVRRKVGFGAKSLTGLDGYRHPEHGLFSFSGMDFWWLRKLLCPIESVRSEPVGRPLYDM